VQSPVVLDAKCGQSWFVTQDRNLHLDVLRLSTPDKTSGMNFCKQQTAVVSMFTRVKTWHNKVTTKHSRIPSSRPFWGGLSTVQRLINYK